MRTSWILRLSFLCTVLLLTAGLARASLVYTFTQPGDFGGRQFQYTAPDFILTYTTVPVSNLDSCTPVPGFSCWDMTFNPAYGTENLAQIGFGISPPNQWAYYYFPSGAFAAVGEYDDDNTPFRAHLSVTATETIPEPGSILLVSAGMGIMAFRVRRRLG